MLFKSLPHLHGYFSKHINILAEGTEFLNDLDGLFEKYGWFDYSLLLEDTLLNFKTIGHANLVAFSGDVVIDEDNIIISQG